MNCKDSMFLRKHINYTLDKMDREQTNKQGALLKVGKKDAEE